MARRCKQRDGYCKSLTLTCITPTFSKTIFKVFYQIEQRDKYGIQDLREKHDYQAVAEKFRLIKDDTVPVVIRYNTEVQALLADISRRGLWSSDRKKNCSLIVQPAPL